MFLSADCVGELASSSSCLKYYSIINIELMFNLCEWLVSIFINLLKIKME
jgi:hypothetical protein